MGAFVKGVFCGVGATIDAFDFPIGTSFGGIIDSVGNGLGT